MVRGLSFCVVVIILWEMGNTWIRHGKLWHGCRVAVPAVAGRRRRGGNEGLSAVRQEVPRRK